MSACARRNVNETRSLFHDEEADGIAQPVVAGTPPIGTSFLSAATVRALDGLENEPKFGLAAGTLEKARLGREGGENGRQDT